MVSELHIRPSVLAGPVLGLLLVAGVAAARADPEAALQGGVMTVVTPQPLDPDPAHAYDSDVDKAIQAATGLFLLSLPDRTGLVAPVPDGSKRPTVSRNRKIWRFVIKKGMRFSDGNAVGPQNFQLAINRNLHLKSIGGQLVRDIVGAPAVLKGTAQSASGITVSGDTLQIKLSSPSGDLDARLATPFFGALPLTLPTAPPFPSAGPYFIAGSTPGSIVLQENPFYGGTRPHHLDGFLVSSDPNRDNLGEVESGRADYVIGGVDSAAGARGGYDTVFVGGTATFSDPSVLLDDLRGGVSTNLAYFNSARVNRLLDQANRAVGPARYRAYGALDIMITAKYAPWAAYDNRNEREFVSRRTGGYLFQPVNASADLNTFFLK